MAALAVLVVAAGAGILIFAGQVGRHPGSPPKRVASHARQPNQGLWIVDTAQAKLARTIPLPAGVYGGGVGGGWGWMAYGAGVLQLNQLNGGVVHRFPVKGGAIAVVYAGGKLWVTPRTTTTPFIKSMLEIDPRTGATRRIAVPGSYDTLFAGAGYVWLPGEAHIDRIDPATGRIEGAIPFGLSQPNLFCAMAFTRHTIWIASAARDQLLRVSPESMRVTRHANIRDTGNSDYCVTLGAGKVWVGSAEGYGIASYNPRTVRPTAVTLQIGRMGWMAGARGALWFTTSNAPAQLHAVNGSGTPVGQVQLPFAPLGFAIKGTLLYAGFNRSPAAPTQLTPAGG